MARFFATVPISEPITEPFVQHANMGGFGWDQTRGMFIIVDKELDMTILPYQGSTNEKSR